MIERSMFLTQTLKKDHFWVICTLYLSVMSHKAPSPSFLSLLRIIQSWHCAAAHRPGWRVAARCFLISFTAHWVIASFTWAPTTNIICRAKSLHNAITPWLGVKYLILDSLPRAQGGSFTCRCVLLKVSQIYNFHLDKVYTQIKKGHWVLHLIN